MSESLATTHVTLPFRTVLEADLRAYKVPLTERPGFLKVLKHTLSKLIYSPGFACVFWYRVNRWLYVRKWPGSRFLGARRYYWFSNDISCKADIGPGLFIGHPSDIVIGANSVIGKNATIYNGVTLGAKGPATAAKKPHIGDDVYIGTGAKLLGDIRIGDRVIVGALTFCDKSLPSDVTVYGYPLTIKHRATSTV